MSNLQEQVTAPEDLSSFLRSLSFPGWGFTLCRASVLCALSAVTLSACMKENKIKITEYNSPDGKVSLTRIQGKDLILPEEIKEKILNPERKQVAFKVETIGFVRIEKTGTFLLYSGTNDYSNGLEILSNDAQNIATLNLAAQKKTTPVLLRGVASMESKTKIIKISVIEAQLLDTTENLGVDHPNTLS